MAGIKFKAIGTSSYVNLNVRFYHNKIDVSTKSNIFIKFSDWSNKTGKPKQNVCIDVKNEIENQTSELSLLIMKQFRIDYPKGIEINRQWIINLVDAFHNKPKDDKDESIYFTNFIDNFIENSKTRINPVSGKIISSRTIQNYSTTLKRLKEYETKFNIRLRTSEVNLQFHQQFVNYLKVDLKYSNTVIEKYLSQIKGFVKEAKLKGYETSLDIESKNFTFKREDTFDTYLSKEEINNIFNLDLSKNPEYEDTRDMLIFGVWTGLRVSDLERVSELNISENRIKILSTEKTNQPVEIPIHDQVKFILNKRKNKLPKITSQLFNLHIKKICKLAKIDQQMMGSIKDPETNRKKKDFYPKYKLISSHSCRRSFVSNHYGKIDDKTIMAITTHKSHTQFMKYVKTSLSEHAKKLDDFWNNEKK